MTSAFDFSGPSKLAKTLMKGRRISAAATVKTARLRDEGGDPSQIHGISHKGDENVRVYRQRNKK